MSYRFVRFICLATLCACLPSVSAAEIGKKTYDTYAMTHQGDPARGKILFENKKLLACTNCHSTDGSASKAGPDLQSIGDKFGRRELVEAILSPSASIAVGYSNTIVHTKSGDDLLGVVK